MPIPQISGGTRLSDLPDHINSIADAVNAGGVGGSVMELDEVRYAHSDGDNASDGLTWGTAKKDVGSAYDALPATGGTIKFAQDTYVDSVNTDRGLWLLNSSDPSYNGGSPSLPGWRVGKPIILEGVGGNSNVSNAPQRGVSLLGGSGSDPSKPLLWYAGGSGPSTFKNVFFSPCAVTARLGVTSTMTGGVAGTLNTALLRFDGCSFDSVAAFATGGPTIELGYIFWLWFEMCAFNRGNGQSTNLSSIALQSGTTYRFTIGVDHRMKVGETFQISGVTPSDYNGVWTVTNVASDTAVDADLGSNPAAASVLGTMQHMRTYYRASIAHDVNEVFAGGTNSGLISFRDCNMNSGGFYYSPGGGTSSGGIFMENITLESDFVNPAPPIFHLRRPGGAGYAALVALGGIHVYDCAHADAGAGTDPAVLNEYLLQDPASLAVLNSTARGPHTQLFGGAARQDDLGTGNVPDRFDVYGLVGREVRGYHAGSARQFAPSTAVFENFVSHDTSTWNGGSGDLVVTTGKLAPNGLMQAAEFANTEAGIGVQGKEIGSSAYTITAGDWMVAGYWRRFISGEDNTPAEFKIPGATLRRGDNNIKISKPYARGDGGWEWLYDYEQIESGSGAATMTFTIRVNSNGATGVQEVFAPVAFIIPASSGLTETDVATIAQHLHTYPSTAPAGSVSTLVGQKLLVPGGLGVGNAAAGSSLGSVTKKVEIFDAAGDSLGFIPVYDAIT